MRTSVTKLILAIALSSCLSTAYAIDHEQIHDTLARAGLSTPIERIMPSPIKSLTMLSLSGHQEPLLISQDLNYVIQGNIEPNPSPKVAIDPTVIIKAPAGSPISAEHKKALLANMAKLANIDENSAFYHTNVDGLLWGVSAHGTPFLVSDDGRHFINGEISVIKNGQFAGLDTDFENAKNRHVFAQLDSQTLTIYPAKGQEKAVVYIATDINCPYCKIFHSKINDFNHKGITIKAIGYPVYDESHAPMRQLWCETDNAKRAVLLSSAIKGLHIKTACNDERNLLAHNQILAHSLAIFATPAIFDEQGVLFQGDFTSDEFLEFLNIQ